VRSASDEHLAADLELSAGWSGKVVSRTRSATVQTTTAGDIDDSDVLTEGERSASDGKRWRLRSWMRNPTARFP
jgi:hypothetical protein